MDEGPFDKVAKAIAANDASAIELEVIAGSFAEQITEALAAVDDLLNSDFMKAYLGKDEPPKSDQR